MNKIFKKIIDRRVPQILGSYFIGATTLLFFIDWLVAKYDFSDYYTSLCLFGLICIVPSVIILAYFHGAPGKDDWTKVEKYGIPINILFIAIVLFAGYKYNFFEEAPPDHSKVYDSFMIHISSTQEGVDQFKLSTIYEEYEYMIDSVYVVSSDKLKEIREYTYVNIKKEFMHHDLEINFAENKDEQKMLDKFIGLYDMLYLKEEVDNKDLQKQTDDEYRIIRGHILETTDYFNKKYDTYVDWTIRLNVFEANLSTKGMLLRNIGELKKFSSNEIAYGIEINSVKVSKQKDTGKRSIVIVGGTVEAIAEDREGELQEEILEILLENIKDFSFGDNIGTVNSILDSNLVTIKLNNLDVIKGTGLIHLKRTYIFTKKWDNSLSDKLKNYTDDYLIIYNYLSKNPDQIGKIYDEMDEEITIESPSEWLENKKEEIDSLVHNYQKIIDEYPSDFAAEYFHNEFRYYLKILNVQDSIAIAKITGNIYPFAYPKVGDKINIK